MKKSILKPALVLSIAVMTLFSCGKNKDDGNASQTSTIGVSYEERSLDIEQANNFIQKHQGEILDVRSTAEYEQEHLDGAINIPFNPDSFAQSIIAKDLDKNTAFLVHCAAGVTNGRSQNAIQVLDSLGFKKVYNLKGGYIHFKGIDQDPHNH